MFSATRGAVVRPVRRRGLSLRPCLSLQCAVVSRPPEYENGTSGGNAAHHATGARGVPGAGDPAGPPPDPPNVYHPRAAAPPPYEQYADPAAAHGWQNTYDATAELPVVVDGGTTGDRPGPDGVRRSGRGARRRPAPRRSRRSVVAASAVGAVSAAALLAGFAFSGSSSPGGAEGGRRGDGATASESEEPAEPATPVRTPGGTVGEPSTGSSPAVPAATRSSGGGAAADARSAAPDVAQGTERPVSGASGPSSGTPTAGTTTAPAPTASASTATPTAGGFGDRPGSGRGGGKHRR